MKQRYYRYSELAIMPIEDVIEIASDGDMPEQTRNLASYVVNDSEILKTKICQN